MPISRLKINAAVKKAFNSLGDIPLSITYVYVTPGVYDPATDAVATTTTTINNLPAVNVQLKEQELEWFPGDINTQKLLIAANDLPNPPNANDYVVIDTVRWEVRRVSRVPGDSLYILYIQEP